MKSGDFKLGELDEDFKLGELDGKPLTEKMVLVMAVIMVIPIIMVVISLTLNNPVNRWANIIAAVFWIGFNLLSLGGYPAYEKVLLVISMGFNALIIWYAWNWV